ncbi:MAG: 2OG-Fe(II) oxygenase [Polymorphobacter sp.]
MSLAARAEALVRAGRGLEARAMIEDAAFKGDGVALLMIAHWRLYGINGVRDWAEVHRLLDRAIASGQAAAQTLKAVLTANGTGVTADWPAAMVLLAKAARRDAAAKAQLDMLTAQGAVADGGDGRALPAPQRLAESPDVILYAGLLRAAECRWLIAAATPEIRPSTIVDPLTGKSRADPMRRAGATNFGPERVDAVVQMLLQRLARASATTLPQFEPMAVLRYHPGDEYRPHLDTLPGVDNQRHTTVLTYLNDDYGGGATVFTESGLEVQGKRGDVLVFRNLDSAGRPDPATRHAGAPVTRGTKWLSSCWIRQRAYDSWGAR